MDDDNDSEGSENGVTQREYDKNRGRAMSVDEYPIGDRLYGLLA